MIERLDTRIVLSSSLSAGLLTVNGNGSDNTIELTLSGGNINVNEHNGSPIKSYAAGSVSKILVNAGGGKDRVTVASSITKPTTLNGGTGNDSLTSGGGNDILNGGDGDDQLNGGAGKDALNGGNNNDVLDGGTGKDFLNGQSGSDTADYSHRSAKVTAEIDVAGDPDQNVPVNISGSGGESGENDTFSGVEAVLGGSAGDALKFEGPAINGGDTVPHFGNFLLDGRGGKDNLSADGATFVDDAHIHVSLHGGSNNDIFSDNPALIRTFEYGDSGDDEFDAFFEEGAGLPAPRIVDAGSGTDTLVIGTADINTVTLGTNLENLKVDGQCSNLTINGNSLNNKIDCSGQTLDFGVTVKGNGGADTITGTKNADKLDGGAGKDIIHGGDGKDSITGGTEADQLFGDAGDDTLFALDGTKDIVDGGAGTHDKAQRDHSGGIFDQVSNVESFI